MVLQTENASLKKNSCWKYIDGFIPFVFSSVNYRWNNDVGDCGMCSKYFTTLCKILMNSFCL
jgi:hypothetical protein